MSCCGDDNDSDGVIEANSVAEGLPLNRIHSDPSAFGTLYQEPCNSTTITNECILGVEQTLCDDAPSCPPRRVVLPNQCCPPAQIAQPYYQKTSVCAEDRTQKIIERKISGSFKTRAGTAMPACGAKIRVFFESVTDMPIGAWLWANGIGYLVITGFNSLTNEIELQNDCPSPCGGTTQAAPGTPIPQCTVFTLGPPQCGQGGGGTIPSNYPYLNGGFTAPINGACIDINVTTVNGLSVGKNVAILTGTYRVSQIKSAFIITICNDGQGLTPGVYVDYEDAAGNLIVPIVLIDVNPCLTTAAASGVPLSCVNNVVTPLIGSSNDQVLSWNQTTGKAQFKTLGIPVLDCTELTSGITLDPTLPVGTSYIANVLSTADYIVGQLVTIGLTQFNVSIITNATQMRIVPLVHPVSIQVYNAGSQLCSAGCCETLQLEIDNLDTQVNDRITSYVTDNVDTACSGTWLDHHEDTGISANIVPATINTGSPLASGEPLEMTFANQSCSRFMSVVVHFTWTWVFDQTAGAGHVGTLAAKGYGALTGLPAPPGLLAELPQVYQFHADAGSNRRSLTVTVPMEMLIAPLGLVAVTARADLLWTGGTGGNSFSTVSMLSRAVVQGIAV